MEVGVADGRYSELFLTMVVAMCTKSSKHQKKDLDQAKKNACALPAYFIEQNGKLIILLYNYRLA